MGRSRSLSEELVNALTEKIQRSELRPGEKLPTESEIMGEYGVSRTVVREAISRLQAARLVETRHGIGTFLLAPESSESFQLTTSNVVTMLDVMAVLELRITVESDAARLAALRRSDADLARMRETLDAFQSQIVAPNSNTINHDLNFHKAVAVATGNRYFHDILEQMGATVIPRTRVNTAELAHDDQKAYLEHVNREHEDIYDAIYRRDANGAQAAMHIHLTKSRERLKRAYQAAGALPPI